MFNVPKQNFPIDKSRNGIYNIIIHNNRANKSIKSNSNIRTFAENKVCFPLKIPPLAVQKRARRGEKAGAFVKDAAVRKNGNTALPI